jgi:heme-degrading monooxygenase HmoA
MILRMTWGKLRAGTWQEFEQAYRATVAGTAVPGLRGRWLAQDVHDPNGGFAVSLWDSLDSIGIPILRLPSLPRDTRAR